MTLKREIFLMGMTYSLIFTFVFILIFGNVLFSSRLDEMKSLLHGSNAQMKVYMDTLFENARQMLQYLENSVDLLSRDPQEQEKTINTIQALEESSDGFLTIFIGYSDGEAVSADHVFAAQYDARLRPWFQKATKNYPQDLVAFPFQGYTSGNWCFCLAKALPDEAGDIAAVVVANYSVETLYQNAIMHNHYQTQANYLIDENGICIYHPDKSLIGENILQSMQGDASMFQEREGYVEYTFQGQKRIGYFHHLAGSDSILVSAINRSDAFGPAINAVLNVLLGLVLLSVLMSMLFMTLIDHRYVVPVKLLKARLSALLGGDKITDTAMPYPNQEFLEIAESVEQLTKRTMNQKAEELNAILESSSDGILVLDRKDNILHYNAQLLHLWGLPKTAAYQTYGDLDLSRRLLSDHAVSHPSAQVKETELCYLKSGIILERYTQVLAEREHMEGILCVYRDATQKVKKEERLKEIANTDFLTGLNNRRYFSVLAARAFRKAKENHEALSLLMIDIDQFKIINDTHGHDIGDRALKAFAMHLRQCSRRSDILGRYGGEEFCVMLPETGLEIAHQIAERVRKHFEVTAIDHHGEQISWTVSIGVAADGLDVSSVDVLMKHADIACYAAKQQGRNLVKTYQNEDAAAEPEN